MKKLIYIPLDERPCNYLYPQQMLHVQNEYELITPPVAMLGNKKESANLEQLWKFVEEQALNADAMVFSVEMMFYGGLLPSRLHQMKWEEIEAYIERLKQLKQAYPKLHIYCSNLIMRTPKYNSSDEEPDYYETYGESIFKRAYFLDKEKREGLSETEKAEVEKIDKELPVAYREDYENRRAFNHRVTVEILKLLQAGVIDFLAIPQDDSAEYGYTAIDQKAVVRTIRTLRLSRLVHMYPGADEVGASLVARAVNVLENMRPKIYPMYASTLGPTIIPLYEDRPMHESVKAHVLVTNSMLVSSPEEADIILAINAPGRVMQESWDQWDKDITYSSFRHLLTFTESIAQFVSQGKHVAICDSAFSNGGDIEFITMLDELQVLDKLVSYKGWNTNCNTLGTTLAQSILALQTTNEEKRKENLLYHIFEDGFYQAIVRKEINENVLPSLGCNYFDLKTHAATVNKEIDERLHRCYQEHILHSFKDMEIVTCKSYSPWNRMFEIGIQLKAVKK